LTAAITSPACDVVGFRRTRGVVLRLARRRFAATVSGLALVGGSASLVLFDFSWESWLTDGFGLVLGATGVALVVAGLGGGRPDWVDP